MTLRMCLNVINRHIAVATEENLMERPDLPTTEIGGVTFVILYDEPHAFIPEAAKYMGTSQAYVHNLVSAGKLDSRRAGRFSAITKKSLDARGKAILKQGASA
jgi:hypothetical protein